MCQTGILAASAAYALTHNFLQLPRVHTLARKLQAGLESIGVEMLCEAETCMVQGFRFHSFMLYVAHAHAYCGPLQVFFDASSVGLTYEEIVKRGKALPEPLLLNGSRLVVHIQTSDSAIEDFVNLVRELSTEKKLGGFVKKPYRRAKGGDVYVRAKL